jgi:hypothetical protein
MKRVAPKWPQKAACIERASRKAHSTRMQPTPAKTQILSPDNCEPRPENRELRTENRELRTESRELITALTGPALPSAQPGTYSPR